MDNSKDWKNIFQSAGLLGIRSAFTAACLLGAPLCPGDALPLVESLSVRDLSMRQFAELMTRACYVPIMVSQGAAEARITVYMQKLDAVEILKSVCRSYGLWYRRQDSGVYEVLTMEEFRNSTRIYQEDYVEVVDILYPAAVDVGLTLRSLYPDRIVWTTPDEKVGDRFDSIANALDRMDQLTERAQFTVQSTASSGRTDDDNHGDRDDRDDGNARAEGVVRRPEKNLQRELRESLVKNLRAEEMLRIAGEDGSSVWNVAGEFGFVYVAAFPGPNQLALRSSDLRALKQIRDVIRRLDTVTPQVLLEVKVMEVALDDGHAHGLDWLFLQDYADPRGQASGGFANGYPGGSGGQLIRGPSFALEPQGSGLDPRAFVFNFITDKLRVRLQLLEMQDRLTALATPTLTVADEEASIIFIGKETTIPMRISSISHYNTDGQYVNTEYDLETERRNIGDTLLVIPKLHVDRTVTLRVLHENSQLGDDKTIYYGQNGENVLNTQDIDKRTAASTVVAGDGDMVALGGLIREAVDSESEGIPFLQNIPWLGSLFRRQAEVRTRNELLVLIIPRILVAPGEAESVTRRLLDKNSQHPSAQNDIPPLQATLSEDIARPQVIPADSSMLDELKRMLRIWRVEP